MNTVIDIISDLSNFSYHSTSISGGGSSIGGGGSDSREVVFAVVLKYLIYIHNSTPSPVTLSAPLLTVFSAQFIVSFSIA